MSSGLFRFSVGVFFFFLMIRRPPRSTLFPYHDALPICDRGAILGRRPDVRRVGARGPEQPEPQLGTCRRALDRKSTRLNSSHANISYAVFCLKKKNKKFKTKFPTCVTL